MTWFAWVAFAIFAFMTVAALMVVSRLRVEHAQRDLRRAGFCVGLWQWSVALTLASMGSWINAATLFAAGSFIIGGLWLQRRLDGLLS